MEKPRYIATLHSPRANEIRRLFAKTINTHEPRQLYQSFPNDLPQSAFVRTVIQTIEPGLKASSAHVRILAAGVYDVMQTMHVAFDHDGNMDQELAGDVIVNDETTETIAELARREQQNLSRHISVETPGDNFFIDRDERALKIGSALPDSTFFPDGCPFAGKIIAGETGPIDPVFRRFVSWAGTLAVLRYFDPAYVKK